MERILYRTQRCIYNTSFQLTGWNGAWVIGDIVMLVAGACHLAISAIPRWINTYTMKPATEAEKQQCILGAKTMKKRTSVTSFGDFRAKIEVFSCSFV